MNLGHFLTFNSSETMFFCSSLNNCNGAFNPPQSSAAVQQGNNVLVMGMSVLWMHVI